MQENEGCGIFQTAMALTLMGFWLLSSGEGVSVNSRCTKFQMEISEVFTTHLLIFSPAMTRESFALLISRDAMVPITKSLSKRKTATIYYYK